MGCRGFCDRLNGKNHCFKYDGAYCSVCMKWLHFDNYGYKCQCCNQRLRLRNKGTRQRLERHEREDTEFDSYLKMLLRKMMLFEHDNTKWVVEVPSLRV